MSKYSRLVDEVIKEAGVLLMVLDARKVKESINKETENKIKKSRKKLIYVINKCDLLAEEEINGIVLPNSVRISASKHLGTTRLLKKIMEVAKGKDVTVGVVGLPNTGKSTLINALKGKHSAPTSPISGFTKGLQKIRITSKILMIDTPGVLSGKLKSIGADLVSIGIIDADKIRDAEVAAVELIEMMRGKIEVYFGVKQSAEPFDTLEEIAIKKHILKKGGLPDTARMARAIIRLCQLGKIV